MEIDDADVRVNSGPMSVSVMWVNSDDVFDNAIAEASHFLPGGDDHWYINRVKVRDQASYGKGIGQHIFGKLMATLKARGAIKIIVEPGGYGSDVGRLVSFYGKFGFEMKGEGPDDPYMSMEWTSDSQE
jgi:ribosomal protein S18 acetylase RimI-like enzyme